MSLRGSFRAICRDTGHIRPLAAALVFASVLTACLLLPDAALAAADYRSAGPLNPRVTVWVAAQMHVWFAAFVLAVPIFVLIIEAAGVVTGDRRYDAMAYEFLRVSMTAYSFTAITGGLFALALVILYPGVVRYLSGIFSPTFYLYAVFFVAENIALYAYYYGWKRMPGGGLKLAHLGIGVVLNAAGTAIMMVANAWVTFMMSPAGVDIRGAYQGDLWAAVHNLLWHPMNLHRFISNIAYGGSIVGAYAAYRFLSSTTDAERAHYDWMGYTAGVVAVGALLPLPFAGYWLTAEIYSYSQQMGITLMGGVFAWMFIIQAVIIGALFLAANYYLWCGLGRSAGGARYARWIKYIAFVLCACFLVWFTPHTLVLTPSEATALGGQYHPILGPLGLMPAKNIAVNIMLLATFLSFVIFRRAGKAPAVSWAGTATAAEAALFAAGVANIVFLGVYYGYYTDSVYKVASSIPQVATTLMVMVICTIIELVAFRSPRGAGRADDASRAGSEDGGIRWGRMPGRSQYALVMMAVSFTWLMGLMGFVRSAIRQHWHVYSVLRDTSPDAYTPSIAYAARVVSIGTIVFLGLVVFIFWLNSLDRKKAGSEVGGE